MKVKDLISYLKAFNPEAEVFQMYDGMANSLLVGPAQMEDLEAINFQITNKRPEDQPIEECEQLSFAVVFWAG